jgi:hypothetical protein
MTAPLPLADLRILALTQLGAGPYAMQVLGDLGAEIVKIEDPTTGGDEARAVPPAIAGDSLYYQSFNRNTRGLTLDLRTAAGRALFRRLAAVADAVYANPRGDLPAKLGLDYASLKDVNPRLVCCTLTGFGRSGPRAADPAYDYLIQALAGFMQVTGEPDGPPIRSGVATIDFAGGLCSALGLMVALRRARETGVGGDVDVSLFDTAISMLTHMATHHLHTGDEPRRLPGGSHPSVVPSQTFPTADGWMMVDVHEGEVLVAPLRAHRASGADPRPRATPASPSASPTAPRCGRARRRLPHPADRTPGSTACAVRSPVRPDQFRLAGPRRPPGRRTATCSSRSTTPARPAAPKSAARSRSTTSNPRYLPGAALGADTPPSCANGSRRVTTRSSSCVAMGRSKKKTSHAKTRRRGRLQHSSRLRVFCV